MAKHRHRGVYGLLLFLFAPVTQGAWLFQGCYTYDAPLYDIITAFANIPGDDYSGYPTEVSAMAYCNGMCGSGADWAKSTTGYVVDRPIWCYGLACDAPNVLQPDGYTCAAPPAEPCEDPWVGDPGACTCPAPYVQSGDSCGWEECSTESPYLDAEAGIAPGVIGCNGGCAYVAVSTFVGDPEGTSVPSTQMKPTGESCVDLEPEPPPFVGTPDPEQCVYDAAGNSICVDGGDGVPENCGSFNGEFVCIPSLPDDTCISTPGGSIMCVGSGAPDSGWNGTREVPTPVPDPSFSWEGIPKPSGGWAPEGGPGSGSPPGQWWPPGADTGGRLWGPPLELPPGTDETPATDPPDPDLAVADPMELVEEQDEPSGGPFGAITWGIPETGSCPAPSALEVLGQTIMVEYDPVCDAMELVRPFVIAIGAFMSLGILMHFGR